MESLKEGTDNRMMVLESLMREIGGDKMKGLVQDVASLQHDTVTLWKENARMVPFLPLMLLMGKAIANQITTMLPIDAWRNFITT
jgi:hypothetical protein